MTACATGSNFAHHSQDKVDTLAVIMDECAAPGEVTARIQSLFIEERGSVTFSTVHGAKGLEAERVFILRPDLMPLSRAAGVGAAAGAQH